MVEPKVKIVVPHFKAAALFGVALSAARRTRRNPPIRLEELYERLLRELITDMVEWHAEQGLSVKANRDPMRLCKAVDNGRDYAITFRFDRMVDAVHFKLRFVG